MVQSVIAMKPRQVLLSSSNGKPLSLSPDQMPLLLQSICHFLESSGFPKTLKKFLSEASLQKDSWKNCLLNLEEACCMFLEARSQNDADLNISSGKKEDKIEADDTNIKSKESKKKKSGKDSSAENVEVHSVEPEVTLCEEKFSKKAKDKKKKKGSEPAPESANGDLQTPCTVNGSDESIDHEKGSKSKRKKIKDSKIDDIEKNGARAGEGTEQGKKSSKKRKNSSSDDNKSDGLGAASEGSKRRKTVSGDEGTDEQVTKATKVPAAFDVQLENGEVGSQTPSSATVKNSKMLPGDNGGESIDEPALKKGSAKKQNGSAEPRTQNAFQRVKPEDVKFVDERLADNSYWAKGGADSGYGAKAQEVLGQVRGRDFRHEKTKKKRGSYRGGIIDEGSHSVKFNYSDDDE